MARDPLREEAIESRLEAPAAVVLVIAFQILVADVSRRQEWAVPWWLWLVPIGPEIALVVPLAWERPKRRLVQMGHRGTVTLGLIALVSLANALMLAALLVSLVTGHEHSGGQLLLKGAAIWGTNVITFGLSFWALDRGGPVRRLEPEPPLPDFRFPQHESPELAPPGWRPRLADYLYLSFTNSIAFSPTDAMPLTRWAKLLMFLEASISATTVLLVAARAINILK